MAYRTCRPFSSARGLVPAAHYDGMWFNTYTGDAVYVGPTLYVQLDRKVFMTAAWNTQVVGHDVDVPGSSLNLSEFSRHRAKLKVAVEF